MSLGSIPAKNRGEVVGKREGGEERGREGKKGEREKNQAKRLVS